MKPKRAIQVVAPQAGSGEHPWNGQTAEWPLEPPQPLEREPKPPAFRPLKVYAFGPSLGNVRGNVRTIYVRYEKLSPGPIGERVAVVDYDATRDCFYDPVDLDDPLIAMNGGLDPSESNPQFHQQMVYAVASETIRRVEAALGRTIEQRTPTSQEPLRLWIYPHGAEIGNAFWSEDDKLVFGYFKAGEDAIGRTVPGQTVFTCLSADVVVHEVVKAIMAATRPDLFASDNMAFQEALADLTSLLFHFNNRDVVADTIHRTAGIIYRSQLDAERLTTETPRIVAELVTNNPLLALSQDLGDAYGRIGGLRNAILAPDPKALERTQEPHARGAIVVAAVSDALFSVYQRRTLDLFRIARARGGFDDRDIPEPLANRLCDEVERIANRVFNMCWRALDYCPASTMELGDFLRACVTADYEYTREDPWGLRDALMQAFRLRGIKPSSAAFFTEDSLRWPVVDATTLAQARLKSASLESVRAFVTANARVLGLARAKVDVYPLDIARRTAPDDMPHTTTSTQVVRSDTRRVGVAIVFDEASQLRYAIPSSRMRNGPKHVH